MSIHVPKLQIAWIVLWKPFGKAWKSICWNIFSVCTQSIKFYREVQSSLPVKFVWKSLGEKDDWAWNVFGQEHWQCWKYVSTQQFLFNLTTAAVSKTECSDVCSWLLGLYWGNDRCFNRNSPISAFGETHGVELNREKLHSLVSTIIQCSEKWSLRISRQLRTLKKKKKKL